MVEIVRNFLDLSAQFINTLFLFQIEFNVGQYVPLGKIVTAFIFIVVSIYLILDAFGILDKGE